MRLGLSLRTRFVVIALVGAVLPLGLVGFWQIGEIERSGETLLRQRLDESIRRLVADIGARWVAQRSELLTLGEHEVIQATVRRGLDSGLTSDASLSAVYDRLQHSFDVITLRDQQGTHRWALLGDPADSSRVTAAAAMVNASVELFDRTSSLRLGALDVRIPLARMVPPDPVWSPAWAPCSR